MTDVGGVLASFELASVGEDRYTAPNAPLGHDVVFGGQLLGQAIVAALVGQPDKRVQTMHTVFARSGRPDRRVDIAVERLHVGRSLASSSVTVSQGDRLCTRSTVLLTADEPEIIRHGDLAPVVAGPDASRPAGHVDGWDIRIVDDVDFRDPELVGPASLDVWTRFPDAPDAPGLNEALLAFASDGFLIGAAMRPHAGIGQAQAHVSISTGVLSHTLTFHERFAANDWLLMAQRSPHAGHARSYGQGAVFRSDGDLVASFVQDAMIRPLDRVPGKL